MGFAIAGVKFLTINAKVNRGSLSPSLSLLWLSPSCCQNFFLLIALREGGRALMRERAGLFMLRSPKYQTCSAFSLTKCPVYFWGPHRSSLGGLSGPKVRSDTSGASGCVEGPQARAVVPARPGALLGSEFAKERVASRAPGSNDFIPRYGSKSGRFAKWPLAMANFKIITIKAK